MMSGRHMPAATYIAFALDRGFSKLLTCPGGGGKIGWWRMFGNSVEDMVVPLGTMFHLGRKRLQMSVSN